MRQISKAKPENCQLNSGFSPYDLNNEPVHMLGFSSDHPAGTDERLERQRAAYVKKDVKIQISMNSLSRRTSHIEAN